MIEGLEDGKVAVVNVIHHAYFDGAGASHVLQQFFSTEPGVKHVPPEQAWQPDVYPSWFKRLLSGARDWPGVVLANTPRAVVGIFKKLRVEAAARKSGKPPHPNANMMQKNPLNKVLGHGRTFVCDSLSLADFRRVGKAWNCTINDVFLSCSAGAMRRYLHDLGFDSSSPLVAGNPLSQRRPENMAGVGNFATADFCWLHTEVEDPVERLQASHLSANEMKAHAKACEGADMGTIVPLLPPWVVKFMSWNIRKGDGARGVFGNVVLSNVVGPRTPLYLDNMRLDNWFSTGQVFDGSSLNMTLWSYCGNANLCILADEEVLPDGWVLYNYFAEELGSLLDAIEG